MLLVELGHSLHSNAFAILQFLGNLLCDFLGRACSSFPILHTNWFFRFEHCPINSPEEVVISKFQVLDGIHVEQFLNFFAPTFQFPHQLQSLIIFLSFILPLNWWLSLSLQNFMKIFTISHGLTDAFTSVSFACHQRFIYCGHRSWPQPPGRRQLRKQTCLRNTISLWFPKAVACTRTKHRRYRASCWLAAAASGFLMRDLLWNTQWCIFLVIVRLVEDRGGIRGM